MASAKGVYRARATDAEIADVLNQRLVAAVGTSNEDGSIHLAYVLFLAADGHLYFETSSITRKARNAERAGKASILVQGQAGSGRSIMVSAEGAARLIRGDDAHEINHRLRAKYLKSDALPGINRAWNQLDDVAVEIIPATWRSWCGEVLHQRDPEGTRRAVPRSVVAGLITAGSG